jgi:inactivated superfamily I helicase
VLLSYRELYNNQKEICNNEKSTNKQFVELERLRLLWSNQAETVSGLHGALIAVSKDEDVVQCNRLTETNKSLLKQIDELNQELKKSEKLRTAQGAQLLRNNEFLHSIKSVFDKISTYVKLVNVIPTDLEIVEAELVRKKGRPKNEAPVIEETVKPVIDLFPAQFEVIEELKNLKK